jgi:hypothetical protein
MQGNVILAKASVNLPERASGSAVSAPGGCVTAIKRLAIVCADDRAESGQAVTDLDELRAAMRPERFAELVADLTMACCDVLAYRAEHRTPATLRRIK